MNPQPRHSVVGSLTGAVASQRVTEARNGGLSVIGNHAASVKAKARLTARGTPRAGTKVGLSDPVVLSGRAIAQRIKGTPGITGLSLPRVHIDGEVWHLNYKCLHNCIRIILASVHRGAAGVILYQKFGL